MEFESLSIDGAWIVRSSVHSDARGTFREWFKGDEIRKEIGRDFVVAQSNISRSRRGVLRGIHYSLAPMGQAKWVTCISGSIWDVVVDIRPSSPTFRKWVGIELNGLSGESVIIGEGLGHGFISLEENSTVSYLLTSPYSREEEFEINPHDPNLAIEWPGSELLLSSKDKSAPTLATQLAAGNLPL